MPSCGAHISLFPNRKIPSPLLTPRVCALHELALMHVFLNVLDLPFGCKYLFSNQSENALKLL